MEGEERRERSYLFYLFSEKMISLNRQCLRVDQTLITNEAIGDYKLRKKEVILKIDFEKAYDQSAIELSQKLGIVQALLVGLVLFLLAH